MKSLFRAVLLVAGFSVLTRFLGFLFRIYLSRELGPELLGVYQVAISIFSVLLVLVSSGIPLAISKLTAGYSVKKDFRAQNGVVSSALIVGVGIAVILCLIIVVFRESLGHLFTDERCVYILITLLPAVIASAIYSAFRGSLWGNQNYFSVCWTELAEQVIRIVAFMILVNFVYIGLDGASIAGLSMSIACVLSATLVAIVYFRQGRRLSSPKTYFRPLLRSAVPVTGVRTASSLIQPVIAVLFPAMLVLAGYTSEQAMESYGMAMGMTFPLLFLPSTIVGAISFTLIPELSTAIAKHENDLIANRIKTSLTLTVFISAMVIPFYIGVGPEIGAFLYDNTASGEYLARAAWIMLPLGLSNISSSILNAYNLEVKSFVNNIVGGVLLLGFVALLSGTLGVDALIWGFGTCMLVTTVLNIYMIKRHTSLNLGLIKPTLLMLLFIIPATLLTHFSYPLFSLAFPEFLAIALSAVLGVGCFVVLCILFKLVDFTAVFVRFKAKTLKKS